MGSFITSSIGTMRVTEQIDALEVMGVNSLNYLVFPKIIALFFISFCNWIKYVFGCFWRLDGSCLWRFYYKFEFTTGFKLNLFHFITYGFFIKTFVFAFILATIPSFHGYYMKGGALEVGKAIPFQFLFGHR